jgi:hypothetical protein
MEEIHIEYRAKLENYFEAAKYFARIKKKRNIFDRIMEIVLILIGIFQIVMGNFLLGIIFIVAGIIFFLGFLEKSVTYLHFKIYISKLGIQKLTISQDKINYMRKDIKSEIEWNYYKGFIETPNTVLLLYGKKYYSVIPKDAFTNEELKRFIGLVSEKFSK